MCIAEPQRSKALQLLDLCLKLAVKLTLSALHQGHIKQNGDRAPCPLQGRRAPELAAGACEYLLKPLLQADVATIIIERASQCTAEELNLATNTFELSRKQLIFSLRVRLAPWERLPLSLAGCAHTMRTSRDSAYNVYSSKPPQMTIPIPLSDADVETPPQLAEFLSRFKFALTTERAIEGQHAVLHKAPQFIQLGLKFKPNKIWA